MNKCDSCSTETTLRACEPCEKWLCATCMKQHLECEPTILEMEVHEVSVNSSHDLTKKDFELGFAIVRIGHDKYKTVHENTSIVYVVKDEWDAKRECERLNVIFAYDNPTHFFVPTKVEK